jgi:ribosomal protein S27E
MMSEAKQKQQAFPCAQCGASMEFQPSLEALICPFCGHSAQSAKSQAIPTSAATLNTTTLEQPAIQEHDYQVFATQNNQMATLSSTALEVQCSGCQANITFEPPETAGNCPFCGTSIVAEPHEAHPLTMPESLLPFRIGKRDCQKSIQTWLSSRWFAPSSLKQLAQSEQLQGVYIPFWTYDAQTCSNYRGQRGDHYTVTKTRTVCDAEGNQKTEEYEETHTRWHNVSGQVRQCFDDLLVPGICDSVNPERLQELEPWPLEKLVPYNASYLAGFKVQHYQVDVDQGLGFAKGIMDDQIRCDVEQDIGGDEQRIHSIETSHSQITFKHILLPVWLSAYQYRGKRFQVVINAQTGEVLGDRPYSTVKIVLAVLGGLLLLGLIVVAFTRR